MLWETDLHQLDLAKNYTRRHFFPSSDPTNYGHSQAVWHLKFICVKHSRCKCQLRQIYACCGLDLQQLQRGQAIKHSAGQLGDLITIQNSAHKDVFVFSYEFIHIQLVCYHLLPCFIINLHHHKQRKTFIPLVKRLDGFTLQSSPNKNTFTHSHNRIH